MRKLATIRQIKEITPIEGADLIVLVKVDDWQCIALKSEFSEGDLCVYFEIDSFIPLIPQVEHLRARAYKKMGDREGIRIKTIKMKGQISQGLALPLSVLGPREDIFPIGPGCVGADVTEDLGVEKYEAPIPAEMTGKAKGNFPTFIRKTDQERCQNIGYRIFTEHARTRYEVTMKLDGMSFTGYVNRGNTGVCSRNWELKVDNDNANNALVKMFVDSNMQSALLPCGSNIAVQGELMGPGIQGNREKLASYKLFVFDIFDIDSQCQLSPADRAEVLHTLYSNGLNADMVRQVPLFAQDATLTELDITDVAKLLADAEGPSMFHPVREGKVYKSTDGQFSFKAISNAYLIKEKD